MIDYSPLWKTMKKRSISQYALINQGIDKHTLDQLRKNQNVTVLTIENSATFLTAHPMMYFHLRKKPINNTVIV